MSQVSNFPTEICGYCGGIGDWHQPESHAANYAPQVFGDCGSKDHGLAFC